MLSSQKIFLSPNGISVYNNSNIAFSSTDDNFDGTRTNSFLKFDNSEILYSVEAVKRVLFSKRFDSIGHRQIKMNSDIGLKIQNDDSIKIIHDEYELDYVFSIENGGYTYNEKDQLTVLGGDLSINILDGLGSPTKFIIEKLDRDNGQIMGLTIKDRGKYFTPPEGEIEVYGGKGGGLKLKLKYRISESRDVHEKVVKGVSVKDNSTTLTLDYSLPPGIKTGQISFEKWEVTLSPTYQGLSQTNLPYKIFSEFTPNYSIPLTIKNNSDFDLIFNRGLNHIDCLIKRLEDRIQNLETKIHNYE
jgi:hypothetical protein